ncbi:MAG: AAA family ATPase [Lachnospiraceae bacterium]
MQIQELYLKNFGKFSEKTIVMKEGINVLYGGNEFGKTTLHSFIKGMLFGMEKGRGRASKSGAFQLYEPWDNPNYYAGVLRFSCGGKQFCLERSFDRYTQKSSLICEDDGEILSIEQGDLEILLGGLNASNYDNTIAIGQLRVETNQNLAHELKDYATDFYRTGNSEIQLHSALELLKSKKKQTELRMQSLLDEANEKCEKVQNESDYIWRDIQKITEQLSVLNRERLLHQERYQQLQQQIEQEEKNNSLEVPSKKEWKRWRVHPISYVIMLLFGIAPFFVLHQPWSYLWTLVIVLAEGLFVWNKLKDGKRQKACKADKNGSQRIQLESIEKEKNRKEITELKQLIEKGKWQNEHIQEELKEKQIIYSNLQENLQELESHQQEYLEEVDHKNALEFAMERMILLSKQINQDFGVVLEQKTSEILAAVTGGKYTKILLSDDLKMVLYTGTRRIEMEQISRGTVEQIYFALRMAASEMLEMDDLPIILDETFAYYDERRLKNTLIWLSQKKTQVIIFTCQKREMELLDQLGIPFLRLE